VLIDAKRFEAPPLENMTIGKSDIVPILTRAAENYGIRYAAYVSNKLKNQGFAYCTRAGLSFGLDDVRINPATKMSRLSFKKLVDNLENHERLAEINILDKIQKITDYWR